MPMTFTREMVIQRLTEIKESLDGDEETQRNRLADWIEKKFKDFVEGWEIRSGKPWSSMTKQEAIQLCNKHPECQFNPGVMSRLMGD